MATTQNMHIARQGRFAGKWVKCDAKPDNCPVGGSHTSKEQIEAAQAYVGKSRASDVTPDDYISYLENKLGIIKPTLDVPQTVKASYREPAKFDLEIPDVADDKNFADWLESKGEQGYSKYNTQKVPVYNFAPAAQAWREAKSKGPILGEKAVNDKAYQLIEDLEFHSYSVTGAEQVQAIRLAFSKGLKPAYRERIGNILEDYNFHAEAAIVRNAG